MSCLEVIKPFINESSCLTRMRCLWILIASFYARSPEIWDAEGLRLLEAEDGRDTKAMGSVLKRSRPRHDP